MRMTLIATLAIGAITVAAVTPAYSQFGPLISNSTGKPITSGGGHAPAAAQQAPAKSSGKKPR
jgi:hypothetical protein